MSAEDIANRFNYHAPTEHKRVGHEAVREDVRNVALNWDIQLPDGREKALAITKLEEAMFWANAAIARQGL